MDDKTVKKNDIRDSVLEHIYKDLILKYFLIGPDYHIFYATLNVTLVSSNKYKNIIIYVFIKYK